MISKRDHVLRGSGEQLRNARADARKGPERMLFRARAWHGNRSRPGWVAPLARVGEERSGAVLREIRIKTITSWFLPRLRSSGRLAYNMSGNGPKHGIVLQYTHAVYNLGGVGPHKCPKMGAVGRVSSWPTRWSGRPALRKSC